MTRFTIAILRKALLVLSLALFTGNALALIDPSCSDASTREGWRGEGFPVDDFIPWNLEMESEDIAARDGKYMVVFGYVVASTNSIVLFPSAEASRSGKLGGALVLISADSPAMRWIFRNRRPSEGYFAVGGVFVRTKVGPALGQLTKIRFAMQEPGPAEPLSAAAAARG